MMQFINKPMAFGPQIITGSPLLSGEVGFAYATGLNSINGAPPYTYAVVSGALPPGLSIVGAAIVGTPTTIGNPYSFALVATDSHGAKSNPAGFSLTVVSMLAITTASPLPAGTQGSAYVTTLAASGGVTPYTWALVAGSLDSGLSLNTATGVISGTPVNAETDTPTFQVTDSLGYEVQKTFSLTVNTNYVVPTITTTSPLTSATNGVAYSFQMQAINGTMPYTWSLTSQTGTNTWAVSASGLVTGTPGNVETDTLNIKLVDAHPTTVGPQAFSLTVSAASVSTGLIKFNPGRAMSSEQDVGSTPTAQWQTEIGAFQTHGTNVLHYRLSKSGSNLENFALTSNGAFAAAGLSGAALQTAITTQYTGFADVAYCFYYLQALCPGKHLMLYINQFTTSSWTSAQISGTNFITNPQVVPAWVANGGVVDSGSAGTLKIPDYYGASTTALYSGPIDTIYSGSSYYGMAWNGYNSGNQTLNYLVPRFWNPPERQAMSQLVQAFFQYTLPAGAAYNAGTAYTPGIPLTYSGTNYLCIANSTGNLPTNATYFIVNPWAGKTFDDPTVPFEMSGTNMEYSFDFTVNTNIPGCPYQNPPHFSAGVQATRASGIAGIKALFKAWCAASPHTQADTCMSFSFNVQSPYDTPQTMGQYCNSLITGGNSDALNTITGCALGDSNHYGMDFYQAFSGGTAWTANGPEQAYLGVDPPTNSGQVMNTPNAAKSLKGLITLVSQHEGEDYWKHLPPSTASSTAAAVNTLITTDGILGSQYPIYNITTTDASSPYYYSPTGMWINITYPALQASPGGVVTLRPVGIMTGLTITSVVVASASSLLITYPLLALGATETGLTGALFRNGVLVSNALNVISGAGTYTDTGLSNGTYVYTLAMFNANGTGPQGAGVSGTLSAAWKTLPVGGGGYVRGLIVAADGTMVGRTDTAGAYLYNGTAWNQLINPTSMPASWIASNIISALSGCYEVAIAPSNTQVFYMNFDNTMWKSANKGTTWTQLPAFTHTCNPNDGNAQFGQKIAVDPNNASIVYAGVEGGQMYVTINGGTSWSVVAGVPAGTGAGICGIVFGPASNQIGNVTQVIYACRQGTGVYVTVNGGTSWALTSSGPTTVQNAQLDASGNYWCSGNSANVWKYSGSWSNLTTGGGNGIQAVAVNPFNNSEIVGVDQGGEITFSSNGGASWSGTNTKTSLVSTDIPWLGPTSTSGGSGNSFYLTSGNAIFSPITNGLLYLSCGIGVFSMNVPSTVIGTTPLTWNDLSVGIENLASNEVICPPGIGPVVAAWDRAVFYLTPPAYPSYYLPVTDNAINAAWSLDYASSDPTFTCASVIYDTQLSGYSHNNGTSWTTFPTFPVGAGNGGCIAASTPSNIVFGVSTANAPSYTVNGGTTWTPISVPGIASWAGFLPGNPNGCWRKICADRVTANTFYLYFAGQGVYTSSNSGASWTQQMAGWIETNHGYANVIAPQIKAVPGNAGQLFYCSGPNQFNGSTQTSPAADAFFFRSINGGTSWTQVANVLQVSAFGFGKALAGGYPAVFINGFVSGVFGFWRSDDNCVTWNNIGTFAGPNGLASVVSMSGDMNIYGRCYVALAGFGPDGESAGCGYAYYG